MKVLEAKKITGSMTRTSKKPGLSYSLPAWECQVGKKLRAVKGAVCSGCYALKGNYTRYPAIKAAQYYRLASLMDPRWTEAMVTQVKRQKFFRWHDAGDLQSVEHLKKIFEVCNQTPNTRHWLPTREVKYTRLMDPEAVPKNLKIVISDHMIDQVTPVKSWPYTSGVTTGPGATCPAPRQGGKCGSCRACWDRKTTRVIYGKH